MNCIYLKKLTLIWLLLTTIQTSWAKEYITPEKLAVLSIDSITFNGNIKPRPCPKGFQSNCPAGVPNSCLLVFQFPSFSGSITITNNSNITATNIKADQNFLNTLEIFQSPPEGITSLAPHASGTISFFASGFPIDPPATIEVKGDNTRSVCFSVLLQGSSFKR